MGLPFLSLFKKKVAKEYFLAFLLRDEEVHAVVFEQVDGRIQVIGVGKESLPVGVENLSHDQLLDSADKAISLAEESLPNNIQTHKTVFGVKQSWVQDSHISPVYLAKLKELSTALDLQPIGFLVFPEAIAHLLQKEEGAPVSGILVDGGEKHVTISLLRAGRIIQTKETLLEENLLTTVEGALKSFHDVEILPSRIILFTNKQNQEATFTAHQWSKSLPFLHVPQITTLSSDFDTRAILYGTATQMGFDAIDLVKQTTNKKDFFEEEETNNPINEYTNKQTEENEETPLPQYPEKPKHPKLEETVEEIPDAKSSEYFGFVKDEDIAKNAPVLSTSLSPDHMNEVAEEIPEEVKEEETSLPLGFSLSGPAIIEGAKTTFAKVIKNLPKNFSFIPSLPSGNKLLFVIPILVILLIGGLVWMIFGVKAQVTLFLTPKVVSQTQDVTFSTTSPTDTSSNIIAAKSVSTSENGKVTSNATGSQDEGDKAKGTVTIFNSDTSADTLPSGTVLTSSNGLNFTLDQSIQVASASGDIFSGTQPGTATVAVTAQNIGTDYNLPSQTKFTIQGTSVMAAKNNNAFSGGSKKTVTVVSKDDEASAQQQLIKNLSDAAKSDLQKQANADTVILPEFTSTAISNPTYDKQVGDQASSFTLSATVAFTTVAYKKEDIDTYTKTVLQGKIPTNLILAPHGVSYDVKDLSVKDDNAKASLVMNAHLIPKIDIQNLIKQIAGQSFTQAKNILSTTPQFSDATFTISPHIFFLPKSLPRISSNITMTIDTHE